MESTIQDTDAQSTSTSKQRLNTYTPKVPKVWSTQVHPKCPPSNRNDDEFYGNGHLVFDEDDYVRDGGGDDDDYNDDYDDEDNDPDDDDLWFYEQSVQYE